MIAENCIKKWKVTGLLEGLSGEPESGYGLNHERVHDRTEVGR